MKSASRVTAGAPHCTARGPLSCVHSLRGVNTGPNFWCLFFSCWRFIVFFLVICVTLSDVTMRGLWERHSCDLLYVNSTYPALNRNTYDLVTVSLNNDTACSRPRLIPFKQVPPLPHHQPRPPRSSPPRPRSSPTPSRGTSRPRSRTSPAPVSRSGRGSP